jgi:hypothetical protein
MVFFFSIKGQRQMTNTRIINWSSSDAKISEFFTVGEVANWWTKKSPLELLIRVVDGFCGNRFNRGIVLGMGCGV